MKSFNSVQATKTATELELYLKLCSAYRHFLLNLTGLTAQLNNELMKRKSLLFIFNEKKVNAACFLHKKLIFLS